MEFKPIAHVTQYTPRACVYACMEMVCFGRKSQQEIHREMKKYRDSTDMLGEFKQLVRLGLLPARTPFGELFVGEIMLVTVPSLNIPGGNHRVVIDTRDEHILFDPNEGRDGAKTYDREMKNFRGFSEVTVVKDCLARRPS